MAGVLGDIRGGKHGMWRRDQRGCLGSGLSMNFVSKTWNVSGDGGVDGYA